MGSQASEARIKAESAFACIGDIIAVERVLYDSGFHVVLEDNLKILAREDPARILYDRRYPHLHR
jgi:hypothetical protein